MKKESIQTRKRKPKNPAKIKGSSGKQEAGGVIPRPPSLSLTQPLMDVLSLAGRGHMDRCGVDEAIPDPPAFSDV